jgi:hypothetical protein
MIFWARDTTVGEDLGTDEDMGILALGTANASSANFSVTR